MPRIPSNQYGMGAPTSITSGSLISFHYPISFAYPPNAIHDPYPLVIITDIWPRYIRGVNLHYLNYHFLRTLLRNNAGNSGFTYANIRPNAYYVSAFRTYVRRGIRRPKRLDTQFLLRVLNIARSFDPQEVENIRNAIEAQLAERLQIKANELESYEEWRRSLDRSQKEMARRKVANIQQAVQGGENRGLIKNPADYLSPDEMSQMTPPGPTAPPPTE